jgi:vacuolar-type H+-ATPase subunit D/Vma8
MDASSSSTSPSTTFTLEDRVQQLDHTLSVLQSERETLINELKSSRKDAQKTEAATRSEIDALKRASDKYSSVEHRARQKVLALQEAVKQTLAAASESEALVVEAEVSLPISRKQIETVEGEYKAVKEKAEKVREEKKMLERKERKRTESMQAELASLTSKLEKLNGRKEKLEMGTIPDLEEELKGIEIEIERAERDSLGFEESVEETDLPENTDTQEQHTVHQRSNRRRHSRTGKSQYPPIQRPIQILRPPQRSQKPVATQMSPSASATSTLSGLARPFEPSPTRQAQLQSTLQPAPSASVKSELNPASTIFSPRLGVSFQPSTWVRNTSVSSNGGGQS